MITFEYNTRARVIVFILIRYLITRADTETVMTGSIRLICLMILYPICVRFGYGRFDIKTRNLKVSVLGIKYMYACGIVCIIIVLNIKRAGGKIQEPVV